MSKKKKLGKLVGAAGTFALVGAAASGADASLLSVAKDIQANQTSPLFVQSATQAGSGFSDAFAAALGGNTSPTKNQIRRAVRKAMGGSCSIEEAAAGLNKIALTGKKLALAIDTVAEGCGMDQKTVVSAMISNAFLQDGTEQAENTLNKLNDAVGNDIVQLARDEAGDDSAAQTPYSG